jgi:hypothetical protein
LRPGSQAPLRSSASSGCARCQHISRQMAPLTAARRAHVTAQLFSRCAAAMFVALRGPGGPWLPNRAFWAVTGRRVTAVGCCRSGIAGDERRHARPCAGPLLRRLGASAWTGVRLRIRYCATPASSRWPGWAPWLANRPLPGAFLWRRGLSGRKRRTSGEVQVHSSAQIAVWVSGYRLCPGAAR